MNGNKLVLEIKLIDDTELEIKFLHWDSRFLSNFNKNRVDKDVKFVFFESNDYKFCMYSSEKGYILDIGQFTLVVPDADNMKQSCTISHKFRDDDVRYNFLKTMYNYLPEWATEWYSFKNDQKPIHKFIIHNQFWIY